ncbi:MAG TPA: F0F1 ATP synthase subunit B [Methylomirabilota bacterium]|nr:F0F1 ATP synthase subunit B [Methylomirabilota bacterium]
MEIFKTFGLDPILIIAQIVNFLVILYILKRFLYKPIFDVFQKREALVKESIEKAEESRKALEKAQKQEKELIKKAQGTANQIIQDAKEQSFTMIKTAEESTKKQTQQMIQEARTQIAQDTKLAEQQLNKHVSEFSVALLKQSLKNVFSDKEQTEIVAKAVKTLEKQAN